MPMPPSVRRWIGREIARRPGAAAVAALAFAVAAATVALATGVLERHRLALRASIEQQERRLLAEKDRVLQDVTRAMAGLGVTVWLLAPGQDAAEWLSDDAGPVTMPETNATPCLRAAQGRHVLGGLLELRRRLQWPERQWTVLLVGRGPTVGLPTALADRVILPGPPGTVSLGHELHRGLDLREGQQIELMGRRFRVHACLPPLGDRDDITIWMNLADAQVLLGEPGRVSAIAAVEWPPHPARKPGHLGEWAAAALPGSRVVARRPEALARELATLQTLADREAAQRREAAFARDAHRLRARLTRAVEAGWVALCGAWLGLLATANARARRGEVGVWCALGLPRWRIAALFAGRWFALGALGGGAGYLLGALAAAAAGGFAAYPGWPAWLWSQSAALALAVVGGVTAALAATRRDPADILREA
jgi:putative ABC transport system permease protein